MECINYTSLCVNLFFEVVLAESFMYACQQHGDLFTDNIFTDKDLYFCSLWVISKYIGSLPCLFFLNNLSEETWDTL